MHNICLHKLTFGNNNVVLNFTVQWTPTGCGAINSRIRNSVNSAKFPFFLQPTFFWMKVKHFFFFSLFPQLKRSRAREKKNLIKTKVNRRKIFQRTKLYHLYLLSDLNTIIMWNKKNLHKRLPGYHSPHSDEKKKMAFTVLSTSIQHLLTAFVPFDTFIRPTC